MAETYYALTDIVKLCDHLTAAMPSSYAFGIAAVRKTLVSLPAADVVKVVRCEDCTYTETDGCDDPAIYCKKWDMWEMPAKGFCYKGDRRIYG